MTSASAAGEAWSSAPRTVNQVAFDRLQELIFSGEIEAGTRLDERTLAERIGVSRTPLREAISQLVVLGVAERQVYRGTFLRQITAREVTELYEVRKALEGLAARQATELASPADLDLLERTIIRGTAFLESGDITGFERADREFHALIVRFSGSRLLAEELERLGLRIQLVRHIANLAPDMAADSTGDRLDVLNAMRAGDADGAVAALLRHIDAAKDEAVRRLTV